jgi:hypothetical protein
VKHITDTLVRLGYLDDLQKGVVLLRDPLGTEIMGRRNKVARHIKNKDDAQKAMLILCREGKVELIIKGLFWVMGYDEGDVLAGRARTSSGSPEHQPPPKKRKSSTV